MKKIFAATAIAVAVVMGTGVQSYASDWDVAGKVFAGIEGIRILTGGNVDVIGTMTGINNNNDRHNDRAWYPGNKNKKWTKQCSHSSHRVWVPRMVWKKKYIPKHTEYSKKYGKIVVEGHYIRYQVENGGRWEQKHGCS